MTAHNSPQGVSDGSGATEQARQPALVPAASSPQAVSTKGFDQARHTPGPWMVSPFYAGVTTAEFGKDGDFLPVAKMLWPTDERSEAETYANARLIAVAPELLALLIEAAEFIQPFNRAEGLLDRIDIALSKARSEQGA